jgi:LysM repeat protein
LAVNPGKLLELYIKPGNDLLLKNNDMVSDSNYDETINTNYMYYIVQQGDTIYGIAQKLGLSTASQIIEMNHIDNANEIAPGRFLKVSKI